MSDEAAFIQAISDAPTDDTARLVYADWLDEHDEPLKAAFLRTECAWASEANPGADPPPEGRRRRKSKRGASSTSFASRSRGPRATDRACK